MPGQLRVGAQCWQQTRDHLLASRAERMAYLVARASRWTNPAGEPTVDLLITRSLLIPDRALTTQTGVRVEVDPTFTREVLLACYESGLSLVDVHTHPFATDRVDFSAHDVTNMRITHREFLDGVPTPPPVGVASLVLGQTTAAGAYTDPTTGHLEPLTALTLVGDHTETFPLCATTLR